MSRRTVWVVLVSLAALPAGARAQVGAAPATAQTFTLEQALQYALDHYPTVRAALEQVNASTAAWTSRGPPTCRGSTRSGSRIAPPPTTSSASCCRSR